MGKIVGGPTVFGKPARSTNKTLAGAAAVPIVSCRILVLAGAFMAGNSGCVGPVHLVGSVGLDTTPEVFREVGTLLKDSIKRVPDGETGPRRLWVSFQYPLLRASPFLRPDPQGRLRATSKFPLLALAEGVKEEEIRFGELGYGRIARTSYQDFLAARERGEIGKHARFQVCLPTAMGVIYAFCVPPDVVVIDRIYEKAMIEEAKAICDAIPHKDIAIQWDFCHEMLILDGQPQDWFSTMNASQAEIMQRMERLCAPIPEDVELGIHICYGDFGGKHFADPKDAGRMVDVANDMAKIITRRIDWIHFPDPVGRPDAAFFAPFKNLKLAPETEIYLGILHVSKGIEDTKQRIAAAKESLPNFGVATECGIARARTPDTVKKTLALYAEAAPLTK
jgi:hypothetical protein